MLILGCEVDTHKNDDIRTTGIFRVAEYNKSTIKKRIRFELKKATCRIITENDKTFLSFWIQKEGDSAEQLCSLRDELNKLVDERYPGSGEPEFIYDEEMDGVPGYVIPILINNASIMKGYILASDREGIIMNTDQLREYAGISTVDTRIAVEELVYSMKRNLVIVNTIIEEMEIQEDTLIPAVEEDITIDI